MRLTIAAVLLFSTVILGAGEEKNVLKNGDFETRLVIAKALDKNLLHYIRNGWDMGRGPIAVLPEYWRPCYGQTFFELIDTEEFPEKKEFVRSGKRSCHFKFGKIFCQFMHTPQIAPGKYELSFWYKGKGRIGFSDICYGINPATGRPGKHLKSIRFYHKNVNSDGKWVNIRLQCNIGSFKGTVYSILYFGGANGDFYLDDVRLIKK